MQQGSYCKYHSNIPAKWYCAGCKISLCFHCVMEERQTGSSIVCPACDKALRKLSTAHAIPPFWRQMPKFFRYPLFGSMLIHLIGLAVFSLLMLVPLWPVVIVASLMLPLMMLRYAFLVLQHTAAGHLTPPAISLNFHLHELRLPLKLYAIMIVLGFLLVLVLYPLRIDMAVIQLIVFGLNQLILPATVVLLAVYNSFFRAINPVDVGFVISTIGWPYLALCGVLLLLSGAPVSIQVLFGHIIPPWMLIMLNTFIISYFMIVTFHLLGYVVYQYHEQLGIKPEVEYSVELQPSLLGLGDQNSLSYPTLQKVRLLIKEGRQQAAKAILSKDLLHHGEMDRARIEMHQLYHQMLMNDKDETAILEHGKKFIPVLLRHSMGKQAVALFCDCIAIDSDFQLDMPIDIHQLAMAAQKTDNHKVILKLINGFVQKHPDYPDTIELLLMAAQSMQYHFGQNEKAKKILNYILKRFPGDERVQQAKHHLMLIESASEF